MRIEIDTAFQWICAGDGPRVSLDLLRLLGETEPNVVFRLKRQGAVGLVVERIELPEGP